jgi:hypothetical protein
LEGRGAFLVVRAKSPAGENVLTGSANQPNKQAKHGGDHDRFGIFVHEKLEGSERAE